MQTVLGSSDVFLGFGPVLRFHQGPSLRPWLGVARPHTHGVDRLEILLVCGACSIEVRCSAFGASRRLSERLLPVRQEGRHRRIRDQILNFQRLDRHLGVLEPVERWRLLLGCMELLCRLLRCLWWIINLL